MGYSVQFPSKYNDILVSDKSGEFAIGKEQGANFSKRYDRPGFRHAGLDIQNPERADEDRKIAAPEKMVVVKVLRNVTDGYDPAVVIAKGLQPATPARYHFFAHLNPSSLQQLWPGKVIEQNVEFAEYAGTPWNHLHWEVRPAVSWQGLRDVEGNFITSGTKWITNYSPGHLATAGELVTGGQLATEPHASAMAKDLAKASWPRKMQNEGIQFSQLRMSKSPVSVTVPVEARVSTEPQAPNTGTNTPASPETAGTPAGLSTGSILLAAGLIGAVWYFSRPGGRSTGRGA